MLNLASNLTSNLAPNISQNQETGCTHITMTRTQLSTPNNSNYTSQGKKKASPCDPIRDQNDIIKVKEYFLNNGRTLQLRLRNYAIFTLGICIGVRGADLLRLKIKDILNPDGTIVDELKVFESKTRKTIYPFVNDTAKEALNTYLNTLTHFSYEDVLFSKFGHPDEEMTTDNLYKLMVKAKDELNLPYHLGAHSLRKTFAYWTIKLHPSDLKTMVSLQEMLNHSSMSTTLHYAGQTKDVIKPMYSDLAQLFSEKKYIEPSVNNKVDMIYNMIAELLNAEEMEEMAN